MRVMQNLIDRVYSLEGANPKSLTETKATDIYHVVSDAYYLRSRDHSTSDAINVNRTLRGNSKFPIVLDDDYTHLDTPYMFESTWDYSVKEFERINNLLTPVTVIQGLRKGMHYDYLPNTGDETALTLAFDEIYGLKWKHFTEVSDEVTVFDEIPFDEYKNLIRNVDSGWADSDDLLNFLSRHGPSKSFIIDRMERGRKTVEIFMKKLGADLGLLQPHIYPLLSLDPHANNSDKTGRIYHHEKA